MSTLTRIKSARVLVSPRSNVRHEAPRRELLPAGWRMARVGDILKVRNGYAFKSGDYRAEGVPLVRQSDLGEDLVDITDAKRVDPCFLKELPEFIVREGDLLIGMSGSLGKIARYQHGQPALQNQRTGLLQVKPDYDPKFAKLVLKYVEPQILAEGKGVAVQNVSASEIEGCVFPLPPRDEQQRIVAEIEKQFTRLDAGVAALKRVQANLKRYRAAVLKAACEGKLVPTEAELARKEGRSYETGEQLLIRALSERRRSWDGEGRYREPSSVRVANLTGLPQGWVWAISDQLIATFRSGTTAVPVDTPTSLPILRSSAVRPGRIDLADIRYLPELTKVAGDDRVQPNDLLFVRLSGSLYLAGACALVDGTVPCGLMYPDRLFVARCPNLSMTRWLALFFQSPMARTRIEALAKSTAGHQRISMGAVLDQPIPLPPFAELERIVVAVEDRLTMVSELETMAKTDMQRANRLRQAILHDAFSAKAKHGGRSIRVGEAG